METKPLLFGLIGFMLGGLLVSVAATMFDKPASEGGAKPAETHMSMQDMSASLRGKAGDDYDEAFITGMIAHHQGAVDMANQSAAQAKHDEIKQLSADIIAAQEKEITQMRQWQQDWGYSVNNHSAHH